MFCFVFLTTFLFTYTVLCMYNMLFCLDGR
jgi:hypothetical protein